MLCGNGDNIILAYTTSHKTKKITSMKMIASQISHSCNFLVTRFVKRHLARCFFNHFIELEDTTAVPFRNAVKPIV